MVWLVSGEALKIPEHARTMTRCWQELLLPLASVAVQTTTLVPSGSAVGALFDTLATLG